jgi:hypothetical protein
MNSLKLVKIHDGPAAGREIRMPFEKRRIKIAIQPRQFARVIEPYRAMPAFPVAVYRIDPIGNPHYGYFGFLEEMID